MGHERAPVIQVLIWLCSPLVRPLVTGHEDQDEVIRKWIIIPLDIMLFLTGVAITTASIATASYSNAKVQALWTSVLLCFLVYHYTTKTLTIPAVELQVFIIAAFTFIVFDMQTQGRYDLWMTAIIMMDILLVANCSGLSTIALRGVILTYLGVKSIEAANPFGLYELIPHDNPRYEAEVLSTGNAVTLFYLRCFIFLSDFTITRRFAYGMQRESALVRQSIITAERVATALARFDLNQAEEALDEATNNNASQDLTEAFRDILANLRTYRPYLPDALFVQSDPSPLPMAPTGNVTYASLAIDAPWSAVGSRETLSKYATMLRKYLQFYAGYEANGDPSTGDVMLCIFATPQDACRFAISLLTELAEFPGWPAEYLSHSIWNGPHLRIGIHCGPADLKVNPVTGHTAYYGPDVAWVIKLQEQAKEGTILISSDVARECRDLKSVVHEEVPGLNASYLLPKSLADRLVVPPDSCSVFSTNSARSLQSYRLDRSEPQAFLRSQLKSSAGTAAFISVDFAEVSRDSPLHVVNTILGAILDASERTNGVVGAVHCSGVVVTWNTSRRSMAHAYQGARFSRVLEQSAEVIAVSLATGVASGEIIHGNVGTDLQRYVMVMGPAVRLAGEASHLSLKLKKKSLVTATPGSLSIAADPGIPPEAIRLVHELPCERSKVAVYELKGNEWWK
eukprot:Sspe_Gene.17595::Locus_6250_Transcript_1_1_Confidence_1.000_Length_2718::g.17595::m.17595